MNINVLNFVWHGLHFPNQVPYRFSFLFSFVALTMSYEAYVHFTGLSKQRLAWLIAVFIGYLIVCEKLYDDLFDFKVFYVSIIFVLFYGLVMYGYKRKKLNRTVFLGLILITVLAECLIIGFNATLEAGTSSHSGYYDLGDSVEKSLEYLEETDMDFYRIELYKPFTVNDPLLYRYRGVAQFASTANSNISKFTRKMGMPSDAGSNTIGYVPSTPLLQGMFGVKYILSKRDAISIPNASYEVVHSEADVQTLKNKYAMPLAFMVRDDVNRLILSGISPFTRQEEFFELASGVKATVFEDLPLSYEDYDNIYIRSYENMRFHYSNNDSSKIGLADIGYVIPEAGQYYLYMLNQTKTMELSVNGKISTHKTPRGMTVDLGLLEPGMEVDVSFELPATKSGYYDLGVVRLREDEAWELMKPLSDEGLVVTEFSDTSIRGTIDVMEDGFLYTSIPYEEGWSVKVNDELVEPVAYKDALIMVPLKAGSHELEFSYMPRGFSLGLASTLAATVIIVVLVWMDSQERKKNTNLDTSDKAVVVDGNDDARS